MHDASRRVRPSNHAMRQKTYSGRIVLVSGAPFYAVLIASAVLAGCAKRASIGMPAAAPQLRTETGMASWYGDPYHGRRTSSGEIYNMDELTAAHRTLPFHTWVAVTNLENNRRVEVRINDRGPFLKDRIIDLSRAAAQEISMIGPGTARVRIDIIPRPRVPNPPAAQTSARYAVQIGAFADRARAEELGRSLASRFGPARLVLREGSPPLWRVLSRAVDNLVDARSLSERIKEDHPGAFIIRVDQEAR